MRLRFRRRALGTRQLQPRAQFGHGGEPRGQLAALGPVLQQLRRLAHDAVEGFDGPFDGFQAKSVRPATTTGVSILLMRIRQNAIVMSVVSVVMIQMMMEFVSGKGLLIPCFKTMSMTSYCFEMTTN